MAGFMGVMALQNRPVFVKISLITRTFTVEIEISVTIVGFLSIDQHLENDPARVSMINT